MNRSYDEVRSWKLYFVLILLFAVATRLVFYTGVFGSDDMTYNLAAFNFMQGDHGKGNYVGSIRYGINIPIAFFFSTFGVSEFSANLWSFICSIGEVVLIFLFTKLYFDKKIALIATFILATTPLHIHFTGRMGADNPLSFFLALSIYLFALAEKSKNARYFFIAGLAFGFTYWMKSSVTILFSPIFVIYALSLRKYDKNWIWFIFGGATLFLGHFILMWGLHDDLFHLINTKMIAMGRVGSISNPTGAQFYLEKLFIDVRYSWLLGPAAMLGTLALNKHSLLKENRLTIIWLCWGILILSLIPLHQKNYMLLFCFPLAIFAAYYFSKINSLIWIALWLPAVLILAGLKQQDIRNHVSNSQALYQLSRRSPDTLFINSQKGINIYFENQLLQDHTFATPNMLLLEESLLNPIYSINSNIENAILAIDEETLTDSEIEQLRSYVNLHKVCFEPLGILQPQGYGVGLVILNNIGKIVNLMTPNYIANKISPFLDKLSHPKPMQLYETEVSCINSLNPPDQNV